MKAFPEIKYVATQGIGSHVMAIEGGMDLRDYFAAKALPLLLHASTHPWGDFHDIHAEQAYKVADAMMKEREKKYEGRNA